MRADGRSPTSAGVEADMAALMDRAVRSSRMRGLVGDGIHLDLGVDDCPRLNGGSGQHGILEVFSKDLVVAAEVARILEVGRHAHHICKARTLFGENALDCQDGAAGFLLDGAADHVAIGILGDLTGHKDEIAGPHRWMEGQVRVLLADRIDVVAPRGCSGAIHDAILFKLLRNDQANVLVSMTSTPATRSTK